MNLEGTSAGAVKVSRERIVVNIPNSGNVKITILIVNSITGMKHSYLHVATCHDNLPSL